MDNKVVEKDVDVIEIDWDAVETNITRTGRGNVGTEKGDLVLIGGKLPGILTENKTFEVFGEDETNENATVDISKSKVRSTTFFNAEITASTAAGTALYLVTSTGVIGTTVSTNVFVGIFLGFDESGAIRYILA